jgi:hypothetical protein
VTYTTTTARWYPRGTLENLQGWNDWLVITWNTFFFFFLVVLTFELRAYSLSHSNSPFCDGFFQIQSHELFRLALNVILLIAAFLGS